MKEFVEYVELEVPNFWSQFRDSLASQYQVRVADVVREVQMTKPKTVANIRPDRMMASLIKAAEANWRKHAKVVKMAMPLDYLLGEMLMLEGDLDILDIVLYELEMDREALTAYLAGCSRHLTNAYLRENTAARRMTGFEDLSDWLTDSKEKPKTASKPSRAKEPPGTAMADVESKLLSQVIGQDRATSAVVKALTIAAVGLKDPVKPVAVLLFAGPTGVGKTELTRATAGATERPFLRIDMSEYQESHSVTRLYGAPPSFVGYDEGGQLTNFVMRQPKSVIVFDEVEKAHPDLMNVLLQIAEEGTLTSGEGKIVSFAETVVFLTTNIGAAEASRKKVGFGAAGGSRTLDFKTALEKFFRPELRGRLTDTIIFEPLSEESILKIAGLELKKIGQRLHDNRKLTLEFAPTMARLIAGRSETLQYGARNIKTTINNLIAAPLGNFLLQSNLNDQQQILITGDESEEIKFNVIPKARS